MTGDNSNFQLGMELMPIPSEKVGESNDMTNTPLALDIPSEKPLQIRKLTFGAYSTALTFSGEVFVWGVPPYKSPTMIKAY